MAWDGQDNVLFAFVVNNADSQEIIYTAHLNSGTLGLTRPLKSAPTFVECLVAGTGPEEFYLMTQQGPDAFDTSVELHRADHQVVYPPRLLVEESPLDGTATLAGNLSGELAVYWPNPYWHSERFMLLNFDQQVTPVGTLPGVMSNLQAAPNPFNPSTVLRFAVPVGGDMDLAVFDLKGRRVRQLHQGALPAGSHDFTWDGRNEGGRPLSSGVYFARLMGEATDQVVKITMLK